MPALLSRHPGGKLADLAAVNIARIV